MLGTGRTRSISSTLTGLALLLQTSLPQVACSTKPPAVADRRCDELADSPYDSQKVGSGVPFAQINISEALPVCEQAATRQPPRPRYQFIYGRVLEAANRYTEAAQAYSLAEQSGYIMAASNLGGLYAMGRGVSQDFPLAQFWTYARTLRLADGPDEVHLESIAKMELNKVNEH